MEKSLKGRTKKSRCMLCMFEKRNTVHLFIRKMFKIQLKGVIYKDVKNIGPYCGTHYVKIIE